MPVRFDERDVEAHSTDWLHCINLNEHIAALSIGRKRPGTYLIGWHGVGTIIQLRAQSRR